jgi:hypothetical protein
VKFAVVDLTGTVAVADLTAYCASQQRQLREHYAACFDGDGEADEVRLITSASSKASDEMLCQIEDQPPADVQGALGYHDLGVLHVYKGLCESSGVSWQSCMSHEVLEARNDTRLHKCVELDDGTIIDNEVCDRVEQTSYTIDGVELSNFNTPECFEPPPTGVIPARVQANCGGLYDWLGKSTAPNQVLPGGYAQQFTIGQGWTQVGQRSAYRQALADKGLGRTAVRAAR